MVTCNCHNGTVRKDLLVLKIWKRQIDEVPLGHYIQAGYTLNFKSMTDGP